MRQELLGRAHGGDDLGSAGNPATPRSHTRSYVAQVCCPKVSALPSPSDGRCPWRSGPENTLSRDGRRTCPDRSHSRTAGLGDPALAVVS
jgi:hypothetical protein